MSGPEYPQGGGANLTSSWPAKLFEIDPKGQVSLFKDTHLPRTSANALSLAVDLPIVPHIKPGSPEALGITPAHEA